MDLDKKIGQSGGKFGAEYFETVHGECDILHEHVTYFGNNVMQFSCLFPPGTAG